MNLKYYNDQVIYSGWVIVGNRENYGTENLMEEDMLEDHELRWEDSIVVGKYERMKWTSS